MSIARNLAGAFDLLMNRANGLQRMDLSADGFFMSFKGLVLAAFIDLVVLMLAHSANYLGPSGETTNSLVYALLSVLAAFAAYGVSMLAVFLMCRTEDTQKRFPICVIAYNWAAPLFSAFAVIPFFLLIILAGQNGNMSALAQLVFLITIFALAFFGIRVMKLSLDLETMPATAIFLASAGVSWMVDRWLSGLFGLHG